MAAKLTSKRPPGDCNGFSVWPRIDGLDKPFLKANQVDILGCSGAKTWSNERIALVSSIKAISTLQSFQLLFWNFSRFALRLQLVVDHSFWIDDELVVIALFSFIHDLLYSDLLLPYSQNITLLQHIPFLWQWFDNNPSWLLGPEYFAGHKVADWFLVTILSFLVLHDI